MKLGKFGDVGRNAKLLQKIINDCWLLIVVLNFLQDLKSEKNSSAELSLIVTNILQQP